MENMEKKINRLQLYLYCSWAGVRFWNVWTSSWTCLFCLSKDPEDLSRKASLASFLAQLGCAVSTTPQPPWVRDEVRYKASNRISRSSSARSFVFPQKFLETAATALTFRILGIFSESNANKHHDTVCAFEIRRRWRIKLVMFSPKFVQLLYFAWHWKVKLANCGRL